MYAFAFRSLPVRGMLAIVVFVVLFGISSSEAWAEDNDRGSGGPSGAVYVGTNQSTGNAVIVFHRAPDGTLSLRGSFPTGGSGIGTGADPLGSQGSVVLDQSNRLLFVVNAASNDFSVFAVVGDTLHLLDKVSSGGTRPISIAVHERLVYVLNAGGTPNIAGFVIDPKTNHLVPLPGSQRGLAGGSSANPAQVGFSLDGEVLTVTEKGTQTIDTYTVNDDGYVSGPISNHSNGGTPFGFEFTHGNVAIVSEAGPNALSSYKAGESGALKLVTGSLANGQAATCWALVTSDGRYAYSVNAGNGTISSYAASPDGILALLNPVAATTGTGSTPTDAALSTDSKFLYVRDGGLNLVHGFRVEANGSLTPVGTTGGLPANGQGIAAR